jgi:NADPH:quinone reductase-like Zn-dependent oxidoreductase
VVSALGYGTRGLSVGQRVVGLSDSYRGGSLAEYVAVEARNLAPLPRAMLTLRRVRAWRCRV